MNNKEDHYFNKAILSRCHCNNVKPLHVAATSSNFAKAIGESHCLPIVSSIYVFDSVVWQNFVYTSISWDQDDASKHYLDSGHNMLQLDNDSSRVVCYFCNNPLSDRYFNSNYTHLNSVTILHYCIQRDESYRTYIHMWR